MRKIDEEEFYSLTKDIPEDAKHNCGHPDVVRIYTMGTHSGYGCLMCGLEHTNKDVFNKPGLSGWK